jgi:hypothetical protein
MLAKQALYYLRHFQSWFLMLPDLWWNSMVLPQPPECRNCRCESLYFFFFFFEVLRFKLRAYILSHSTSPFYLMDFFQNKVSANYLPGLASNLDPPNLCLLNR